MPNCFQLVRKSDGVAESLAKVDEEICAYLRVECHPRLFYLYWYDVIGFALACGKTFDDLRKRYANRDEAEAGRLATDATYMRIVDFLDENYTVEAWAEIGKR